LPRRIRDYADEYAKYQGTAEQKKNRAKRNTARRQANASGQTSKGDGNDIDHKTPLSKGGSNAKSNRQVLTASSNRSFQRTKTGAVKK
jgi:5-methylcytosine-specific restriction endonuclease McrA